MSFGTNTCLWISKALSAGCVMTSSGSTCAAVGKPGREAGNTIFCVVGDDQIPSDCGMFQLALSVASALPEASGAG